MPSSHATFLWAGQMVLNWAWSPTWFTLHLLWPAFAIIVTILALIVTFIVINWKTDRVSALLFVPLCGLGRLRVDAEPVDRDSQLVARLAVDRSKAGMVSLRRGRGWGRSRSVGVPGHEPSG